MSENAPDKVKSQKPIPAYRDTFVHFLFGTPGNEPILMHCLNAILESDRQSPTKSVEIRNPFNPATFITEKYSILDVKATDERGDIFVIEFQTSERITFADRMTYYGCRAFGSQLFQGGEYSKLKAVIAIAVTAFEMFDQLESIHNTFVLTAKADSRVVFTNLFQLHVLEAAKEKISRVSLLPSALGAWINFFYYSHLISEDDMTALLQDHPVVQQAYGQYKQFNQDERLRALDEAHQIFLHDQATDREEARIGAIVGIARNMKGEGFDVDVISRMTGLSAVEIDKLS
jgi:predicted transposase/invertase (TIGR01784 family)